MSDNEYKLHTKVQRYGRNRDTETRIETVWPVYEGAPLIHSLDGWKHIAKCGGWESFQGGLDCNTKFPKKLEKIVHAKAIGIFPPS